LHISVDCNQITYRDGLPPLAAVEVSKIPVMPVHRASRLSGSFIEFYNDTKFDEYKDDYLEITFTDESLIENPMQLLKTKFPFLLSINQSEALNRGALSSSSISEGRKTALSGNKSMQDIFKTFVQDLYKEEESIQIINELLPSFIEAAKEAQEGERSV